VLPLLLSDLLVATTDTNLPQAAIAAATKRSEHLFTVYIWVLIVTGLVLAVLTWLVWDAGNKVQDAIRRDADAKIASAGKAAGVANEAAGKANERAAALEHDNLELRGALAQQQEKAATAERQLIELKESLKDRVISEKQANSLVLLLKGDPSGPVDIMWIASDPDSYPLAMRIKQILTEAGWTGAQERMAVGGTGYGLFILVHQLATAPQYAGRLQHAFKEVGIELQGSSHADVAEGKVQILIGHKKPAH
jgi:hypothetical protein